MVAISNKLCYYLGAIFHLNIDKIKWEAMRNKRTKAIWTTRENEKI